jgi:bacteriorhodopsin
MHLKTVLISFLIITGSSLIFTSRSYALVPLVPILAIPLIKIIAVLFAGLSLPFTSIGFITAKIKKANPLKYGFYALGFLILIIILTSLMLIIFYRERISF